MDKQFEGEQERRDRVERMDCIQTTMTPTHEKKIASVIKKIPFNAMLAEEHLYLDLL